MCNEEPSHLCQTWNKTRWISESTGRRQRWRIRCSFTVWINLCSFFAFKHATYCHMICSSKWNEQQKSLIHTSCQWVGSMPTLVGCAGAVLGFSGSAKISACWKHQLYGVICFCWVLPVRKQMLTTQKCTLLWYSSGRNVLWGEGKTEMIWETMINVEINHQIYILKNILSVRSGNRKCA